jgi:hypothetical protein
MNILAAVMVLFNIGFLFGCNESNPQKTLEPKQLLMEMQEKALSDHRIRKRIDFPIDVAPALEIDLIDLLTELEFLEERYLILFWLSCGPRRTWFKIPNYGVYVAEVAKENNQGSVVFEAMRGNFRQFLFQKVLAYGGNKEALLFRVRSFYYGKMNSIWRRLTKPGNRKFDMLDEEFLFCEKVLNKDLEVQLDLEFTKFLQAIDSGDLNLIFKYEKRVYFLVQFLCANKSKGYGLQRFADDPCPYRTLLYFYYQTSEPARRYLHFISQLKKEEWVRKSIFGTAFNVLQKSANHTFQFAYRILDFTSEFMSPYPELFSDKEYKVIVKKIVSKFLDLFDYSYLISDKNSLLLDIN